jgi:hypothetical protein
MTLWRMHNGLLDRRNVIGDFRIMAPHAVDCFSEDHEIVEHDLTHLPVN